MKNRYILILILIISLMMTSCSFSGGGNDNPPSTPLLTVDKVTENSVRLVWSGSFANGKIKEYRVYRDDDVIAKVKKTEYIDEDVKAGEEYLYEVLAVDDDGNKSDRSAGQTVKVTANVASGGPTDNPTNSPTAKNKLDIMKLSKSSVKVYIIDDDFNTVGTGSGTVIDESGFILTNYHCVGYTADDTSGTGLYNSQGLVGIALTDDVKAYSQPQYLARFMGGDNVKDIAVIKMETDLNGNPIPADLALKSIQMSDSEDVQLGEDVNILGFPGVGGETITFTSGRVSGFIDEDGDNETDWIKTDALVNHGNSGGTALNQDGLMIGIPTAKIGGEDNDQMFFLRPINLATRIIKEAYANYESGNYPGNGRTSTPKPTQKPTDPGNTPNIPDDASLITFSGRVVDADTEEPVFDAVVIALIPGITVEQFLNEQLDAQIAAYAYTDENGFFTCSPEMLTLTSYGVLIVKEGYELIAIDDALYMEDDGSGIYDVGDVYMAKE